MPQLVQVVLKLSLKISHLLDFQYKRSVLQAAHADPSVQVRSWPRLLRQTSQVRMCTNFEILVQERYDVFQIKHFKEENKNECE